MPHRTRSHEKHVHTSGCVSTSAMLMCGATAPVQHLLGGSLTAQPLTNRIGSESQSHTSISFNNAKHIARNSTLFWAPHYFFGGRVLTQQAGRAVRAKIQESENLDIMEEGKRKVSIKRETASSVPGVAGKEKPPQKQQDNVYGSQQSTTSSTCPIAKNAALLIELDTAEGKVAELLEVAAEALDELASSCGVGKESLDTGKVDAANKKFLALVSEVHGCLAPKASLIRNYKPYPRSVYGPRKELELLHEKASFLRSELESMRRDPPRISDSGGDGGDAAGDSMTPATPATVPAAAGSKDSGEGDVDAPKSTGVAPKSTGDASATPRDMG